MTQRGYRLTDLIVATGVSPSTIQYWIWRGLIKTRAVKQGRYSYYPPETLDEILRVRDCYESNLKNWREVRDRLYPVDDDDCESPDGGIEYADDGALG